jgi:hypothetical protein
MNRIESQPAMGIDVGGSLTTADAVIENWRVSGPVALPPTADGWKLPIPADFQLPPPEERKPTYVQLTTDDGLAAERTRRGADLCRAHLVAAGIQLKNTPGN